MYLKRILLVVVLAGLIGGGLFAYKVYSAIFTPNTAFNNEEAYVYINSDATINDVKETLKPLLINIETFEQIADRKGYSSNIKGGKYAIKKGMNNNEIINTIRRLNIPVKLSFNNQETLAKLAGRVAEQIEADSVSLVKTFEDEDFLQAHGFNADTKLAMYIPNTYEFLWNTNAEQFRERMLEEYKRFWTENRLKKAKKLNLKPTEVIALASIVQKETAKIDERPRVAGLYLNRVRKGMLLQADPTVIFAHKKKNDNFDLVIKRVLFKHLEINSPYNTYKNTGVPPGPITMPDISSIDAVLSPEKHSYYYMVANVKNFGYHKFAKTLAQHNQNKIQYVRWVAEQNYN